MTTLEQATSRELEIQQVRNAITRTAVEIMRVEGVLAQMREKQISRHREIAIQETLARCSNDKLCHAAESECDAQKEQSK